MVQAIREHCECYEQQFASIEIAAVGEWFPYAQIGADRIFRCQQDVNYEEKVRVRLRSARSASDTPTEPAAPLSQHVFVEELLKRRTKAGRNRVFVTGEGGSGKTVFGRTLAWEFAKVALAELARLGPEATPLVPCFVTLRELAEEDAWPDALDVNGNLAGSEHFSGLVEHRRLVFILDGLDELAWAKTGLAKKLRRLVASQAGLVVLTGRPGSLEGFGDLFEPQDQFVLQPLSTHDTDTYVTRYFRLMPDPGRAVNLLAAIRQAEGAIRPMLSQPFMLALTCHAYAGGREDIHLPSNPADLMDRCLSELFRRRFAENGEVTDTLCFDTLGILFARSIESHHRLPAPTAVEVISSQAGVPEAHAKTRLNVLAPGCGVLAQVSGFYQYTNRVVAEYLAARWIARNGWHGLEPTPVRTPQARADIETSLFCLYRRYVWSDEKRNLLRWVGYALAARTDRRCIVPCVANWLARHLLRVPEDSPWEMDPWRTLAGRFLDVLSAIPRGTDRSAIGHVISFEEVLAHTIGEDNNWLSRLTVSLRGGTSSAVRRKHLDTLCAMLESGRGDVSAIGLIATLLLEWPGDARVFAALCERLKVEEEYIVIEFIAVALAMAFAENDQAAAALQARLSVESKRDDDLARFRVMALAKGIALGWSTCPAAMADASAALHAIEARPDPLGRLARALAKRWPVVPLMLENAVSHSRDPHTSSSAQQQCVPSTLASTRVERLEAVLAQIPATSLSLWGIEPEFLRDWVVMVGPSCPSDAIDTPLRWFVDALGWLAPDRDVRVHYGWFEDVEQTQQEAADLFDQAQTKPTKYEVFVAAREQLTNGLDPALRPPTVREAYATLAELYEPHLVSFEALDDAEKAVAELLKEMILEKDLCVGEDPPVSLRARLMEIKDGDVEWAGRLCKLAGQEPSGDALPHGLDHRLGTEDHSTGNETQWKGTLPQMHSTSQLDAEVPWYTLKKVIEMLAGEGMRASMDVDDLRRRIQTKLRSGKWDIKLVVVDGIQCVSHDDYVKLTRELRKSERRRKAEGNMVPELCPKCGEPIEQGKRCMSFKCRRLRAGF